MAEEPDVIRHQIEETRESLTDKLETLEGQVKDVVGSVTETIETVKSTVENTVESVKSGVENTVETVKSSLTDTVDTVKQTFDVSRQVDRHPWAAVGCSLAAGLATGYLLVGPRFRRPQYYEGISGMNRIVPGYRSAAAEPPASPPARDHGPGPSRPGFLSSLLQPFEGELGKVKEVAIGALIGMARDALRQALPPSLAANVSEVMDNITRKAGGEPVRGPVLQGSGADDGARGSV